MQFMRLKYIKDIKAENGQKLKVRGSQTSEKLVNW